MKRLVPMFDNSGARYSIPEDRVDEFRADMGEVAEARRYRGKDGQHYTIPQDQDEAFRADMPDAVPVRSYTMADGTRRDFTMGEMAKFLRSKEYRESEDYTPPQMGSPTWAGIKGALTGAAEGAYYGGKNALAKVATALPEAAASVGEAVGDAVNLGGNAKNPVGDWLRASGQQTKRWLGENIRGDQYDENGNLVMSGLTKDLGYEDTLTKIGETAGDAAAMAVKFAPAAIAGPAYMETILASDGINAFADTFDRAKAAGYSDMEANLAGAASGLINYYGAKLMMKGGAATKDIANPLLRALAGTGFTGAATAAQAVGNKGVENVIEGKPITEGMLGAAGEGFVEGAQFHLINEVGTNAKASMQIRRETREMKEMRKENLLTATETPDGRAFLNTVVQNEGVDAAIRARKDGKDVSRKMGAAADLPDNMSASERNAVIDGISKAREAQAERVRTKMDDVQAQSLADEIGQNLMGGASDPMFEDIWLNATRRVKNAAELDEPGARARIVGEAIEDVVGKQLDAGPANRIDTPLEKKIAQNRSRIGQEQKAQRKSDLDEYERQEQERIAREKAELEMGRRIEAQGEAQRKAAADKAQADYDEKMAAYEEARAKRAAEKKRGVAKEKLTPLPEKPVEKKVEEENLMPTDDELYEQARNKIGDGATSEEIDEVVSKTKATLLERGFVARKSKKTAQVGKETPENAEIGATKAENAAENVQPTKVPDGRGRMVEKNSGDISSESVNSELERYVGKDELSNIKDRANSTKFENGGFPEDISVLAETCRGIANRTGNPPSAKSLAEAVADSWKRHTYESIKATADIILDAYKRDGKKVPKIFADKYGTEPDADFYQKNTKSEEERLASVYGMKPQPSKPLENAPSRAQKEAKPMSQADGAEGKEARNGASSVDDFVSTMKPMAAAKAKKTLGARRDYGIGNEHDVMTDAEFVERNVQKGGVVSARVFATSGKPKVSYILGDTEITKTQFDYAKHLGVKVDANSIERAKEEVLLKGVLAKGEGASKRDYFPSDENVEKAIKELDGTNFVKYRKDLKEELDTLKSIRDARIKRGDWSIEQKTTSPRVPDGKGRMVKKPAATAEESSVVAPTAQADGVTPALRERLSKTEIGRSILGNYDANAKDDPKFALDQLKRSIEANKAEIDGAKPKGKQKVVQPNLLQIDTATPAQKLADPDFKAWARKQGRTPTDGARRIYDAQRVDAVFATAKNWLKGVKLRRTENAAEVPQGARMSIGDKMDDTYMDAVKRGDMEYAQQMVNDRIRSVGGVFHRGKSPRDTQDIVEWADNPNEILSYGEHQYAHLKKHLKEIPQFVYDFARKYYPDASNDAINDGVNPRRIVDSAGAWDDRGFVSALWERYSSELEEMMNDGVAGFKTKDGAVSFPQGKGGNLFKSADPVTYDNNGNVIPLSQRFNPRNSDIRYLYSKDGNVVGWYDRAKKEVVTLPGADAATVAHELGWHATYEYAQTEAAAGRTALLDKLTEYANNAPQSVKNEILRKYGMATDAATLLDEIGAARYTMDNVNKIKDVADRRQAAKWYQRTWNAIADTYKAMLSKFGWNKARLDNLSALTPEETVNLLADEMLKGRTLGKAKSSQIDMSKGETIAQLHDRKLKDRLRPIEEIEKEAGKSVENSAHTLFRNLPGKVQGAIDKAQNFADKVKADCKKAGIKIDELNEFLYANAASERNAKVLARNGRLDGSAMSHADIQRILTAYRNSPKYAELRRIADEVLAFQRKGFDFRRKAGLISDETWNTLLADEPNHVPMKSRFDPNGEHMGFSLTEQFGKPEWKTAEGRTNVGDGPLEWIVQEYVDAFSRGHENTARRALLETVLAHPEIGEVKKLGPNDALGEVKRKGQQGDPNVFIVKTDGDTYQVKLNGTRGELIARAVSGRGLMRMDWTNAKIPHTEISVRNAMRWWSATATSWSPTFAGRNFLADTMDVFAVNVGENGLIKGTGKFGKHVYTALKLTNAIRKYASTGETTNPLIREAVDAGVLMGGGVRSQAFADAGDAALKTLKTDWGNGKNRIKAVRNVMFGWIDTLNQTAELMNRMADYKMQREAGKGKNEAALHAREITVDFNEKGELTPITNMLYMFSNSTLGATMRLNKAIFASKEGKSLAAGTFALGLIEGMAEALSNGDDEDGKNMNEYTRANSFYFRSGKNVFRIPLHASPISVIKYAGNCTARKLFGTLNGDKAAEQVAKDMIGMMTSYLGIGALGDNEAASIAPTIVQPFVQAYMNRDFADRPIERTSFSEEKPKSGNGRPSTPQFYKDLATWLNEFGGGNAGRKGELNLLGEKIGTDFSPEMLKHFAEATGKNALRDIENTVEFAKMVLGKTEWDRRNVPVGRDYFRTTGGNDNRFFEAVRAYKTDAEDFKQRTGSDKSDFRKSHPWLREGNDGKTTVNRLINMTNRDNPRSGLGSMGITQLRKLTEGKVRRKDGSYFEPKTPVSDELKERAREWLQKRQARVIEIMGK